MYISRWSSTSYIQIYFTKLWVIYSSITCNSSGSLQNRKILPMFRKYYHLRVHNDVIIAKVFRNFKTTFNPSNHWNFTGNRKTTLNFGEVDCKILSVGTHIKKAHHMHAWMLVSNTSVIYLWPTRDTLVTNTEAKQQLLNYWWYHAF